MKGKAKLLISIISMVLCAIFAIGSVFAWFVISARSNDLFIYMGNIDLSCQVYVAIDARDIEYNLKADGVPDLFQFPVDNINTRIDYLNAYYHTMAEAKQANLDADGTDSFKSIHVGRQVLYKIVITNKSTDKNDAIVSVSFADMTNYMKECVELYFEPDTVHDDYVPLFRNNSPRLLFNIRSRQAAVYSDLDGSGKYNSLRAVQQNQDQLFPEEYLPLWRYSRGIQNDEYFIRNVELPNGHLLEIDFSLNSDFFTDEFNNYIDAAPDMFFNKFNWSIGQSEASIKEAIRNLAMSESLYIVQDNDHGGNKDLQFTIGSIIIRGEQRP